MPRHNVAIVFDLKVPLNQRSGQIPHRSDQSTCHTQQAHGYIMHCEYVSPGSHDPAVNCCKGNKQNAIGDNAANEAFYRFLGTDLWAKLVLAAKSPYKICAGIRKPGTAQRPDNIYDAIMGQDVGTLIKEN